ncbi:MAG: ribonuclease III [Bryobacteraceae bacterium]
MSADLGKLEEILGHRFQDQGLLRCALTHSSHSNERLAACESHTGNNEQLEFLGDSILGFLISEFLVGRYPSYPEGRLSKLRAHLVSAVHLEEVARKRDLGAFLFLGRGEEMSGGRTKKTLLVNALEALIAALYLDGGMERARAFVLRTVVDEESAQTGSEEPFMDYKSALQELAQGLKLPQPRYVMTHERGPEHSKTFTIEVRIGRDLAGHAEGASKKSAAQKAARLLWAQLRDETASQ